MEVDKSEWQLLQQAINEWEATGKLTKEQGDDLRSGIVFKRTERQQIAQYFFFIALFCTLLAFGAIFINEKLLERVKAYFSWSDLMISLITASLGAIWFWYVRGKRNKINPAAYETYMVLGGLAVLTSLIYACKEMGRDTTYTTFLTLSCIALAALSILLRSKALWIGAIVALISWFGVFSTWQSDANLFMGMNYPVRYTVLGACLLASGLVQGKVRPLSATQGITYVAGLMLFFTGLWAVSIFGNYNTLAGWHQVRQIHVLAYSIAFGIAAAISFYLGIRYKDKLAQDFGVLFLLINLYTRYFEYFWDAMNKGIFFLVLAITFGVLGWWLDRQKRGRGGRNEGKPA